MELRPADQFTVKEAPEATDIFHYAESNGHRVRMAWAKFEEYLGTVIDEAIGIEAAEHIADDTLHFTMEGISITESQISDFGDYADADHDHVLADITDAGTAAGYDVGTGSGNIPVLGAGGKLATSVIPSLAIKEYLLNWADLATALADAGVQAGERGDWFTVDTSGGLTYIITTDNPTLAGHVTVLKTPTGGVSSVNGDTGAVTLDSDDIDEGSVNLYYTDDRVDARIDLNLSGTPDTIARWKTSGGGLEGSSWQIGAAINNTANNIYLVPAGFNVDDSYFTESPGLFGYGTSTTRHGLAFSARTTNDGSGAVPIMQWDSRYHNGSIYTPVINRDLFAWSQNGTILESIRADKAHDFKGNVVTNYSLDVPDAEEAAFDIADAHNGQYVRLDGTFTITLVDGMKNGHCTTFRNKGAGTITLEADTTLENENDAFDIPPGGVATVVHEGADVWVCFGSLI